MNEAAINNNYNVTLTGELIDHTDPESAIKALATLFKIPQQTAETYFKQAPLVIKKSVNAMTAEKFQQALHNAGLHCHITVINSEQPMTKTSITEQVSEFSFEMAGQPDYGFITVNIPANDMIKVEASSMATMDTNMRMKTKMRGGFSRLLTGESIFINEFTAEGIAGEIGIAPAAPGDVRHQYLDGDCIYLQNSAFVACGPNVEIKSKWQGMLKGFFSGENLFLIRAQGKGDLWFNSYGAIIEIDVSKDYVVDTGNIVGFTEGLDYEITKVGGYKALFFSGEGFVCRFKGKGKVWIQTRSAQSFIGWAHWFRPVKKRSK